jgi:hypothetical protein
MKSDSQVTWVTWVGRILTGLLVSLFLLDGGFKVVPPEPVLKACEELGIPASVVPGIGISLLISTALYAIPTTTVLGAILLTGYLGGAVMTHVRVIPTHGAFSVVFAVVFGMLVWLAVYLREPRLRALVPLRCTRAKSHVPSSNEAALTTV